MAAKRTPLDRDTIVTTAIGMADAKGLEQLSMRKLASALGVEAMSIYYHVPNKDELIDGMVDHVIAEMTLPSFDDHWKVRARPAPGVAAGHDRLEDQRRTGDLAHAPIVRKNVAAPAEARIECEGRKPDRRRSRPAVCRGAGSTEEARTAGRRDRAVSRCDRPGVLPQSERAGMV